TTLQPSTARHASWWWIWAPAGTWARASGTGTWGWACATCSTSGRRTWKPARGATTITSTVRASPAPSTSTCAGTSEVLMAWRRALAILLLAACGTAGAGEALREEIADALVRPDGAGFAPYRWEREPRIVALYFGADWCAPCHAFVPVLREMRDALQAAGADTEVVYVSLDADEATMNRYMRHQQMPWPAIDHRRMRTLPRVRALAGPAPPNLVLVDRSGRVLASGWEGRLRTGLQPVLEAWLQFVAAPVDSARPTSAAPVRPRPGGRRDSGGVSSTDAEYRLLPTRRQDIDVAVNQQQ